MAIKTTMTMTALLAGTLALAATADKVDFTWKPIKGSKTEYMTTNSHEADMGGGVVDLVITWDSTVTVDKVDGKRVTLSSKAGDPIAEIDGVENPGIQVRIDDSVSEYGLNGQFFAPEDDEGSGFNFGLYSGFVLPKTALDKGESYTVGGMTATYVGTEKVKKWNTHKFTFKFKEKGKDAWSEGTVWLSTDDMSLIKRKAILHEVDFGMGPEDVTNEITRRK